MDKTTFSIAAIFLPIIFAIDLPVKQEQRLDLLIGNCNYTHGGSRPNL